MSAMKNPKRHSFKVRRDADGSWNVTDSFTLVYGIGDTLKEALIDYATSLAEWAELDEWVALQAHSDGEVWL